MLSTARPTWHLADPALFMQEITAWLTDNLVSILLAVGAGVAIFLLLNLVRGYGTTLCRRTETSNPLLASIGRAIGRTTQSFIILAAARLVVGYVDPPAAVFITIRFLFTVVAVIQGALWAREIILGYVDLRTQGENGSETLTNASGLIRVLVSTALFIVAAIMVLDNIGVNVTGLVAGLGIGGIAIGLAAQGIFSDLFASLSIIFDRPFHVGETIDYGSGSATVERIGLKSTRLRAITGEKRIISNAQLLGKEIISYAGLDQRRNIFKVGLIYQTKPTMLAKVPDLMRMIVEAEGAAFVRSGFIGFGDSSLDFEVQFDVLSGNWDEVYAARHRIGLAILSRFNDLGLEFAYPTQTTFTSDPDGRMIMPYLTEPVAPTPASSGTRARARTKPGK